MTTTADQITHLTVPAGASVLVYGSRWATHRDLGTDLASITARVHHVFWILRAGLGVAITEEVLMRKRRELREADQAPAPVTSFPDMERG